MRAFLLALVIAAVPALAQNAETDSTADPSRFSLRAHSGVVVASSGVTAGFAGLTGAYELAPGTAATLSATGGDLGAGRAVFVSFGPGLEHSRALDDRSELAAAVGLRFTGSQSGSGGLPYRGTQAFGAVGADRAFKVAGSVEIVPTVGAYAGVGRWAEETNVYGDSLGGAFSSVGLLAGARVRFSAFGRTIELPLVVPVEVFGRGSSRLPAYAESPRPQLTQLDVDKFIAESRVFSGDFAAADDVRRGRVRSRNGG